MCLSFQTFISILGKRLFWHELVMVIFIGIKQQKLTTKIGVYSNVNESHSEEKEDNKKNLCFSTISIIHSKT